jgi:hypothetical protein
MPSDQLVDAKIVLEAMAEVKRRGTWTVLQDLERSEPELASFVFEEFSLLHSRLFKTGANPKQTKILQRQVQRMLAVTITALSVAHRRLWKQDVERMPLLQCAMPDDDDSPGPPPSTEAPRPEQRPS